MSCHHLFSSADSTANVRMIHMFVLGSAHICMPSMAWIRESGRLDSFLRRSIEAGFYPPQSPMYEELCEALENGLFKAHTGNPVHPFHHLLPPKIMKLRDTMKPIPSISNCRARVIACMTKTLRCECYYRHAYYYVWDASVQ